MTCEEFEQILLNSHDCSSGDGWMLRASRTALVQEHVKDCPACATRIAETTRLEDALDRFRVSTKHMEAPVSVEEKLLHTFRENAAMRHSARGFVFPWKLLWVSMATVVLVVAGILLRSKLAPDSVLPEQTKNSSSDGMIPPRPVPDVSSAPATASDQSRNPAKENPQIILRRRFAETHARTTEPGKVPAKVEASDVLSLNGGGSVVRVTLPVSSLIAMGVPVRPDLSESRVTADVWMDPFGAVVGVRLVPASACAY